MTTQTCKACTIEKPLTDFTVRKTNGRPFHHCKACAAAAKRAERAANPEAIRSYQRAQYEKNKETILPRARAANKQGYRNLKAEVHTLLGGKCAICEVTAPLQVDHVSGGGRQHRIKDGNTGSLRVIRDTARRGEAEGVYQLLCANHHYEKTLREITQPD